MLTVFIHIKALQLNDTLPVVVPTVVCMPEDSVVCSTVAIDVRTVDAVVGTVDEDVIGACVVAAERVVGACVVFGAGTVVLEVVVSLTGTVLCE